MTSGGCGKTLGLPPCPEQRRKPLRLTIAQLLCRPVPPIVAQRLRHWIYPQRQAFEDDHQFVVAAQTGSLLKSATGDLHGYRFCVHGYYEWRNWAIALALCSKGDVVVEIGANVGTETVGFADIVGPGGKVFAFEPLPSNVAALKSTLRLNGQRNVTVLPLAVADRVGTTAFAVPPNQHASGAGYVLCQGDPRGVRTIQVKCVTLDSLGEEIGPARLVFVDAEGSEPAILRGGRAYLSRYRPALVLEASPQLLARGGYRIGDLCIELANLSYEAYRVSRLGLKKPAVCPMAKAANWLCLHESRLGAVKAVEKSLRRCGLLPCLPGFNPLTRADGR